MNLALIECNCTITTSMYDYLYDTEKIAAAVDIRSYTYDTYVREHICDPVTDPHRATTYWAAQAVKRRLRGCMSVLFRYY